ncbi:quinone oxidoreductase family protein [Maribacter ulvicola]|uniref:Putative oxidoreductase n=1 Tax=Maribacter ulvicola TaxID=228959 RepID=A0A1N6QS94_9FLAO|nr:zinc-binding dehydrogenase [Maribacter ulvicola]SIQ19499.1 putative oxidoreductase [Maribacter ulvicola]
MKAVRIFEHGDIDVLKYDEYEFPEIGEFDVLVKVKATSVSGWDIKYRKGAWRKLNEGKALLPGRKGFPLPQQLGRESAGEVVQVGNRVSNFEVGDRVLGLVHPENSLCENAIRGLGNLSTELDYPGHTMFGGNAQYISRPEHYFMKLPENVSFRSAAAGAWAYPTAHRIITDRLNVQVGDVVFVSGSSGGMGIATIQWANLKGALIIGTTRNSDKIHELERLGCDKVVNTSAPVNEVVNEINEFTKGRGVDHAIEYTGASNIQEIILKTIRTGGTICPVGGDMSSNPFPVRVIDFTRLELNMVGIRGSRLKDQVAFLWALSLGTIKPIIFKTMPLNAIKEAHELVENGKDVVGKVMLDPWVH